MYSKKKKECIKYINRSMYFRGFVPKMTNTLGGGEKSHWNPKKLSWQNGFNEVWTSGEDGMFPKERGDLFFWNKVLHLFFTLCHIPSLHSVWVCLRLVCPINANLFLHRRGFMCLILQNLFIAGISTHQCEVFLWISLHQTLTER